MNNVYSRKSYVYWYSLWQNKFILLTKPKSKENWNPGLTTPMFWKNCERFFLLPPWSKPT